MAAWNQLRSLLFGGAIGAAARTAIEPQIEPARQRAWSRNRNRILDMGVLAELVAEGAVGEGDVLDLTQRHGYEIDSLLALAEIALHAPDLAMLMQSRRRGDLTPDEFDDGLSKLKIKPEFRPAIRLLLDSRLSPADVANAVQQGFVPNAGLLPGDPGGSPPFTPGVEEVPIDTLAEFRSGGVPEGRAKVLAQLVGLPPGPMELLQMWNRKIITETAVEHGIREGHTKSKWTSALKELRWFLLSPQEAAGLRLRGWITKAEAEKLGDLRGASPEVMEYLYLNRGRPATTRQVHIGYARGATLPGAANEEEAIRTSVKQSNIRTEYADLLYAQRFTYPSAFVIRALAQDGTFSPGLTETILVESGWKPEWAKLAADKWGGGAAAGPSAKWADRARSNLYSSLRSDYVDGGADEPLTREGLTRVGALGAEQDAIIALWEWERLNVRRDLTQAQILKLYKKAIWTRERAAAALDDLGMDAGDASDLLASV